MSLYQALIRILLLLNGAAGLVLAVVLLLVEGAA